MDQNHERPTASKGLRLRVSEAEHKDLKREADSYGYDLSTLLRLRIFGKIKGMRITRRPSTDIMLLGDIIGKLTALTGELNKIGSNINQIAKRLNQGQRDLFGLDSCLRLFEQLGQKILKVLTHIEAAITGRLKTITPSDDNKEE
ncbi:MAG: plasmid mobilization relaxosome protein MobC [Alphaproteobacteria bacterium]|nr:plasmid mobilization relaxosome protein MobC [Alphaproteobacteria bacterium]